ncbi:HNH endonuclease signature motif containing protein [Aureivirga marina]|uniref:HNH endonuclease signature motif containing protein n=1 Tax=Aureivirga marina TaxID=1182451 RepID=UPI0018C9ACBA|nr:HNH endonuclease signature motif containing protein [Aureivirga marina]
MNLKKFDKAHRFLDKLNIPRLSDYDNNVELQKIDLTKQEVSGKIKFEDDGVYLEHLGNWQRGYMYIKKPFLGKYGFPKFHILECKAIIDQKNRNNFDNRYYWANTASVDLIDYNTGKEHKNTLLDLCKYCQRELLENTGEGIETTEDFYELLDINNENIIHHQDEIKTDIKGRPLNWRKISNAYRATRNFTCEECGFGGEQLKNNFDKRYIHVHHINPYELTNTHTNNLKCLCILCHSEQDEHHQNKSEKLQIESFISSYSNELEKQNNPYLKKYQVFF